MSHPLIPRVFVSAANSDLRTARKVVNEALTRIECLPVEESVLGTEYGPIREMLARKIESCQAVIHLVGRDYGGEPAPQTLPDGQPRRSWTQIECDLAKGQQPQQKLYLLVCDDTFPFDPITVPEPADKTALQLAHRETVLADQHLWHTVRDLDELQRQIENLKVPLDLVRSELRRQQIRHQLAFGLAAIAIVLVLGCVIYGVSQLGKKVDERGDDLAIKVGQALQETAKKIESTAKETKEGINDVIQDAVKELTNPVVLAERIRKEIHVTAEEKIRALPDEKGRGQLIAEIEKERDIALGRVDDLIKLIQEGLKEGASPVFQRAAEILQKEGTDAAIKYLESRRPSTLEAARRYAEQAKTAQARADEEKELRNKSLQALVLEAELLETKLQWKPALELRDQVAELAPDWFQARNAVGLLYLELARFQAAEPHMLAATKLAATPGDEAISLSNLAQLLQETNRLADAEMLMRRALAIGESYGAEHPNVAIRLNNLALLLQETNRLAEAETLMRRALAIDEQSYGDDHSNVAIHLNNLAQLFRATNRLPEAEPLMRRALVIDEQSYGAEHPNIARDLNNLAQLLQATNRLAQLPQQLATEQ